MFNEVQTDVLIMDFTKAFDKVEHKRLLWILNHYGISLFYVPNGFAY